MPASDGDTPLTFDSPELVWDETTTSADTPPVSDPSSSTPDPAITPAAATVQSGSTETPGAGATPQGPIPFERHKAILDGERAEWERKLSGVSWADELKQAGATPEQVRQGWELQRELEQHPAEFVERLLQQVAQHPQLAHVGRQWAARHFGNTPANGNGHAPADSDAEPQADRFTTEADGTRTLFMSADRQKEWAQWRIRKELQPFVSDLETRKQQAETQRMADEKQERDRKDVARITGIFEELRKDPLYVKYEPDVVAFIKANNYKVSPHDAYLHVLRTKYLPTVNQTVEAQTVAKFQKDAFAGSGVSPSSAATSTPKGYTSFKDIPKSEW